MMSHSRQAAVLASLNNNDLIRQFDHDDNPVIVELCARLSVHRDLDDEYERLKDKYLKLDDELTDKNAEIETLKDEIAMTEIPDQLLKDIESIAENTQKIAECFDEMTKIFANPLVEISEAPSKPEVKPKAAPKKKAPAKAKPEPANDPEPAKATREDVVKVAIELQEATDRDTVLEIMGRFVEKGKPVKLPNVPDDNLSAFKTAVEHALAELADQQDAA